MIEKEEKEEKKKETDIKAPSQIKFESPQVFNKIGRVKDYEILEKLGQGTFGIVQKAIHIKTKKQVALKQFLNHSKKEGFPVTSLREITILKQLKHENVLEIIEILYEEPKITCSTDVVKQRGIFYTVFPYMSCDLVGVLENPKCILLLHNIKCLMKQLLEGIRYIHEKHFLHRDLKSANILINITGVLKIADFGLSRLYHGKVPKLGMGPGGGEREYTGLVVTRWYRPPEILLGERMYTTAIDIWGIGCVFAELFIRKPVFASKTDSEQIRLIFELIGSPKDWKYGSSLLNKHDYNLGLSCKRTLEEKFSKEMPKCATDLLSGLLALDPYKRLNALDALNHEFFTSEKKPLIPEKLFNFKEELHEDEKKVKRFKPNIYKNNNRYSNYTNYQNYHGYKNCQGYKNYHKDKINYYNDSSYNNYNNNYHDYRNYKYNKFQSNNKRNTYSQNQHETYILKYNKTSFNEKQN